MAQTGLMYAVQGQCAEFSHQCTVNIQIAQFQHDLSLYRFAEVVALVFAPFIFGPAAQARTIDISLLNAVFEGY